MRQRRVRAVVVVSLGLLAASVVDPGWFGVSRPGTVGGVGASTWLHLVGYATLAAVLTRPGRGPVVPVVAAVGYGAVIEVLQFGLPYRTFSFVDMGVNTLGACLGVALTLLRARLRDR